MKIAITAQDAGLDAPVDPRFGRAKYFVVVDLDTDEVSVSDNSLNLNAAQGAGIQAGANVVKLGVGAVVTGHVGPKAFATLQAGNVAAYTGAEGTVAEAVAKFKAGELEQQDGADVEGHWI